MCRVLKLKYNYCHFYLFQPKGDFLYALRSTAKLKVQNNTKLISFTCILLRLIELRKKLYV